jgi:hypothetical protein
MEDTMQQLAMRMNESGRKETPMSENRGGYHHHDDHDGAACIADGFSRSLL